jgi:hypothetical protein
MKKIFISLIFLLIANHSFAETTLDFEGDPKIKIDENYKCEGSDDKSFKLEIGFHRVNGKMFFFLLSEDEEDGYTVRASLRVFNNKVSGYDVVSYIFPFPTGAGLAGAVFLKNYYTSNILTISWFKDDSSIDWFNNYSDLVFFGSRDDENFDQKLIDYSEKALDHIFKALEFGEPFEPDDVMYAPDGLVTGARLLFCK